MYHVGRPGERATPIGCSRPGASTATTATPTSAPRMPASATRAGWATTARRPTTPTPRSSSLISAHLESGHYFNPHAQRIIEAQQKGATVIVCDPRLSNTGSQGRPLAPDLARHRALPAAGDHPSDARETTPGTRTSSNAGSTGTPSSPRSSPTWPTSSTRSARRSSSTTPSTPRSGPSTSPGSRRADPRDRRDHRRHPTKFASHNWRAAGAGNMGGWQVARCLFFIAVMTGSVATDGGTSGNGGTSSSRQRRSAPRDRTLERARVAQGIPARLPRDVDPAPALPQRGTRQARHVLQSGLQPDLDQPRRLQLDGSLTDPSKVGCHVALTPTWSETSWFADYVLPMGVGAERHDVVSYETHQGRWIAFRQSVFRRYAEINGEDGRRATRGPTSSTPARSGKRTSSGSTCRGASTPTVRWASAKWFESKEHPATRSASTSTTARCSPSRCPGSPRPQPSRRDPARVHAQPERLRDPG